MDAPDLLRQYRARHGWSQSQAAAATGVALETWQGWERGRTMPQQPFVTRLLAEALALPAYPAAEREPE